MSIVIWNITVDCSRNCQRNVDTVSGGRVAGATSFLGVTCSYVANIAVLCDSLGGNVAD